MTGGVYRGRGDTLLPLLLSTYIMSMSIYNDSNPKRIEDWIDSLSVRERTFFNTGYAVAIRTLMEDISEIKTALSQKIMSVREEDDAIWEGQLLARMDLLDKVEQHYSTRLQQMKTPI